jgi:PAS domain S-box-containing protein
MVQQKGSKIGLETSAPSADWTVRYDAVFCIFAAVTAYLWGDNGDIVLPQALYLIALFLVLNLSASLGLKRWPTVEWLAALIISANCGVVTALLAYSGGIDSNLWVLYILPVTAACVMLGGRVAALVTAGALCFISVYYYFAGQGYGPAVWLEVGLKDAVLVFVAFTVWRLAGRARLARREARVQEKLKEAAEEKVDLFRLLLDDSADAVFIADAATGRLLDHSRATEQLYRYSRAELSGLRLLDLDAGPYLRERSWDDAMKRLRKERHVTYETEMRTRGGALFPAEASLGFIPLSGRDYLIAVVRDARQRRVAEEERSHSRAMEATARLAGGVAHDFNNILTTIMGQTELRLQEVPEEGPVREGLSEVLKAAERAAALTKALLTFGSSRTVQPVPFDLSQVIEEMRESLSLMAPPPIDISFHADKPVRIVADPAQTQQVIVNLARNAAEAMSSGGMLVIASSTARLEATRPGSPHAVPPGEYGVLNVTDSGAGMDARARERLFEPFFTTKKEKGAGLGLATVYGVVRKNGGYIQVRSEPGQGTDVSVFLPVRSAPTKRTSAPAGAQRRGEGPLTVLLAEDEAGVRVIAKRALEARGYRVLAAHDGQEACEISRGYPGIIDLLLTDVDMPNLTGPQAAQQLASERPDMKVLYISGLAEDPALSRGLIEGVDLLTKPFMSHDLARFVSRAFEDSAG